jgi:biopolymer transport protein ExbD
VKFTQDSGSQYLSAFNFSSLTDIVMLLLIFFLLTSSFVTTRGLDVVLPQADNSEAQQDSRLFVDINEEKQITVNDRTATVETLPGLIQAAMASDSSQIVVIRADQTLTLGDVVGVLDLVKGAGAKRFFIATSEEK